MTRQNHPADETTRATVDIASELQEAADKLRALAIAATHEGRVLWEVGHTIGSKTQVVVDNHERPTVLLEAWAKDREQVNEYLAAFASPAVALAVVGWLEAVIKSQRAAETAASEVWPGPADAADRNAWLSERVDQDALTVARNILGTLCTHCNGEGGDPDDPGDWDPDVYMHNPNTRAACSKCKGTGKQSAPDRTQGGRTDA
ncbi:hypothetical protein [Streptomyces sp. 5-10]|uniref:hypothetical protein n=1 Tax=Streptomyces sp. 5-10 TaxID=878925 RepID=UPI00168BEF84|nr:hypothetical protein [Streptomyces sp. 5-10]MBD3004731.1 hypothetical protein [Streptomyces sp. 5-10]